MTSLMFVRETSLTSPSDAAPGLPAAGVHSTFPHRATAGVGSSRRGKYHQHYEQAAVPRRRPAHMHCKLMITQGAPQPGASFNLTAGITKSAKS